MKQFMHAIFPVIVILLGATAWLFAQPNPDTLWARYYGGSGDEWAWDLRQTADSGFVIVGRTTSYGIGDYDIFIVKTSRSGDTLWTRTYGDSLLDDARSVALTSDGGYAIAGIMTPAGSNNSEMCLIRTNDIGDTLWTHSYGYPFRTGLEGSGGLAQTTDGGYIVAGYRFASSYDIFVVRTDWTAPHFLDTVSN